MQCSTTQGDSSVQGREEGAGGADAGWVVEVVGACGAHLEHCHALRARSFAPCRSAHRVSRAGCSLDYQFRLAVAKAFHTLNPKS